MESVIATREEVQRFLYVPTLIDFCFHSYGEGYYNGDGYGDGYGSDYGDGYGNGDGIGSGNGKGYSYGKGFGDGTICGSGSAYGAGDGYVWGINDKDIKTLNGNLVDYVDDLPTIITQVRDNIAYGYIVERDLTLSPCYVAKVGKSFAHGKTIKDAFADAEAKEIERLPIEKRIKKFIEVFGSLDTEHTGKEFYDWHHVLTGSCRIGRDAFCKAHNIDLDKMYSVKYFIDITKESYGGDIIKLIRKAYKEMEE